jgi:hypothetical protein
VPTTVKRKTVSPEIFRRAVARRQQLRFRANARRPDGCAPIAQQVRARATDLNYSSLRCVVLVRKIRYEIFMSQFRAFFAGLRTVLAALIVCALMTGGTLSPAAAHAGDHAAKSAVDCHKLKAAAKSLSSEAPANEDLSGHCPECCLSASFVDLILPARAPTPVRARVARAEVVFAHLVASEGRESLISGGGNGARAPPIAR